jgi:hypothetical protein
MTRPPLSPLFEGVSDSAIHGRRRIEAEAAEDRACGAVYRAFKGFQGSSVTFGPASARAGEVSPKILLALVEANARRAEQEGGSPDYVRRFCWDNLTVDGIPLPEFLQIKTAAEFQAKRRPLPWLPLEH